MLGSSGTGKGTRMNQLLTFLCSKFDNELYYTDIDGKSVNIGILITKLDILFLGKYVDNKKTRNRTWTSLDGLWSKFGGTEQTVSAIKKLPYHILCEGYSNMDTFRVRPVHMSSEGCRNLFYQVYSYGLENKQEYLERIKGRSGKYPKGDTAFDKETQILKFPKKIEDEFNELCSNQSGNLVVCDYKFDISIDTFGIEYLDYIEEHKLVDEFVEFSKYNQVFHQYVTPPKNDVDDLF